MKPGRFLLALLFAAPAQADCADEVAGLYRGGALDPFARPNRVENVRGIWPDGHLEWWYEITYGSPLTEIHCTEEECILFAHGGTWQGDAPSGPWRRQGAGGRSEETAAFLRRQTDGFADSVSDAVCEDTSLDGRPVRLYRYHARSQPGIASWSEGDYSVWVDAETGWAVRVEKANSMRAVAPDPRPYLWVTTIENDPTISISVPGE